MSARFEVGQVWEWLHDEEVVFVVTAKREGFVTIAYLSHDDPSRVAAVRELANDEITVRDHKRIA